MRLFFTGGQGFIGRHLVDASKGNGSVDEFAGDVTDPAAFSNIPRADLVYHLAAQSKVPESVSNPRRTWQVNVDGTLNLLEWARRTDSGRIVFVSTAHVYGPAKFSPINETHPTCPTSPYGASKLAAELLVNTYCRTYGLEAVIVRPFNVFGPGQAPGFLIPDILHQIHEGKRLVLGDPRPVRDFTFVDDAVSFLVAAGRKGGLDGDVLNLGSGKGHAVRDVVDLALDVSGSDLRPEYDEKRFRRLETPELIVDNQRAMERLDWKPQVSLREGMRRTWVSMGVAV